MNEVQISLSKRELELVIHGMSSSQYPDDLQREAFNLILKLRDKLREAKLG
jgi:hypothetical protein